MINIIIGVMLFGIGMVMLSKKDSLANKESFMLANRNLGYLESSFSIAATWVWIPAILISSQKAFLQGFVGLFWFITPNILCLILFAFFMVKLRKIYPTGITLSEYIKNTYSDRTQNLYWISNILLLCGAFALQLIAGGKILSLITGIQYSYVVILLAIIPISYSFFRGEKITVISDYIKISLVILIGIILLYSLLPLTGGYTTILYGLNGITGGFTSLFNSNGIAVMLAFGIPTTFGLISGPFGDQSFWQKGFSIKEEHIKKSFITGAFIFGLVPLLMACFGFLAAGLKLTVANPQFVIFEVIKQILPGWGIILFVILLLLVVSTILDSKLSAAACMFGNDINKKFCDDDKQFLKYSRYGMVFLLVVGVVLANLPFLTILHLFLINGTVRSITFLPTLLTIGNSKIKYKESFVFYGILASLCIGTPIFVYGTLTNQVYVALAGSILTIVITGISMLVGNLFKNK